MLLGQHLGECGFVQRRPLSLLTQLRLKDRTSCTCAASSPPTPQLRQNRGDLLSKRRSAVELAGEQLQRLHGPQEQVQSFLALNDPEKVDKCGLQCSSAERALPDDCADVLFMLRTLMCCMCRCLSKLGVLTTS